MKIRLTLLLSFLVYSVYAQKVDDILLSKAEHLNEKYEDANMAILTSKSVFEFFVDKKTEELYASQEEDIRFLALRANTEFVKRNYYNDKSSIEYYSLKSDKGKSYQHDKACGHHRSGDIFYSDAQICGYKFNMDFKGQAVDFNSKTVYSDPRYLTKVFFHDELPTSERTIVIKVPSWANIEPMEVNFEDYNISKSVQKGEETTYTYVLKDAEALGQAENAPGSLLYLPHILLLTKSYQHKSDNISVLSSTDDLYNWYHTLTSQLGYEDAGISAMVQELTAGLDTDMEKAEAIYYWVQDNIKYIAFENGLAAFKPEEASKVFYNRYGDCKGMANLTKTMLRMAGFDARLTWIGTNRIPYTYDIPSLAVDNHMICTLFMNGQRYVLDPTEKYNPIGQHAERIQGKQILIEDGDNYTIDRVNVEPIERYLNESRLQLQVVQGNLKGKGTSTINGEYKKNLFNYIYSLTADDVDDLLSNVVAGSSNPDHFTIAGYSELDRNKPLTIDYDMKLDNKVNVFDKEMYLEVDFVKDFKGLELEEDRNIPYDFGRKVYKRTTTEIEIPQGYTLDYMPEPFAINNDYFQFDLKYEVKGNMIIYTKEIKLLNNILPVTAFEAWNSAVAEISEFYNDQIILKADD